MATVKLPKWVKQVYFYVSLSLLYGLTITLGWYAFQQPNSLSHIRTVSLTRAVQTPYTPAISKTVTISGLPVRLIIPGSGLDLTVIPGYYDSASGTWTLSGYDAQFAMISSLANNIAGQTFIYGHNNDFVFGALRHNTPLNGAQALIYTNNGHILAYSFVNVKSVGPDDVSILNYNGSSTLSIQTCTGSFNEWRTEYNFAFNKVIQ